MWLTTTAARFHGARLDVPNLPEVPHCAVCLESDRHLGPLFTLCCCSAERRQPAAHHAQLYHRSGKLGGRRTCSKGRLLPFVVRCSARCLASFLSRGLVLCLWRAGEAPSSALLGCVPSASALGSVRGGAARGLEVRGPVLQLQAGGLGAGFAVEGRLQWRRGCGGPEWWPPGLALGERPWPLMTGESAGPCGVLAPSLDVARRCLCRLISFLASFT